MQNWALTTIFNKTIMPSDLNRSPDHRFITSSCYADAVFFGRKSKGMNYELPSHSASIRELIALFAI